MADATVPSAPAKRRRWPRILLGIVLGLVLLVVAVYFVGTSSAFFKGVILPKISKQMNASVTVRDASIKPFSQVVLHDLKVQTAGAEPLLTATEVRARYSLFDIIGGKIHVEEVTLDSPTIQIIENADGTSNLDAISKLQKKETKEKKPPAPSKSSKPPELDVKKVVLANAIIRTVKHYKGGGRDLTELSNVNLTLTDLKNGQTGKLTLAAAIKIENNPPSPGTNGTLQAKLDGNFNLGLSPTAQPGDVKGQVNLVVENAGGALSDLKATGATLNCDVTPNAIKEVALRFQKGGAALGQILVSGPLDMEKNEGHLTVQVLSIDRQVLNLVGASKGIDFGSTTISSTNQIDLANSGQMITAAGELDALKFSLTRTNQTTPPIDLRCAYNLTINQTEKSALLRTFTLTGLQSQRPLMRAELASPMSIAWGAATPTVPDSTLNFSITNLNLADWKPFIGESVSAGMANLNFKLQSQQSGKQLVFDLSSQLEGLTAKMGANPITQAGLSLQSRGQIADMKRLKLEDSRLQLTQQNQPVLLLSTSGQLDSSAETADLQLTLNSALPKLLQLLSQPDLNATAGTLELKSRITRQKQTQSITGNFALTDFTGRSGNNKFQNFNLTMDLELSAKDQLMEIRKMIGALRQGTNSGGGFELTGHLDSEKKSGQVALKLSELNQNALRPFLEAALGDKKLVSASVNGGLSASFVQEGDSSVKGDLKLAKLVVSDPQNQLPATPLEAGVQIDASLGKQMVDIRQFQLSLSPTARAKNQFQMQGKIDRSQTNAMQGGLKLAAESLDLTPYYDLFGGKKKAAATASTAPTPPAAAPKRPEPPANQEPPAKSLPFRNFLVELNINRFYLGEVAITNWATSLKLDGAQVSINPLQLVVNGGPINGNVDLNLGVPGYQYAVNLTGDKIPLEPLANTFVPDKRGMYKGDLLLNSQIKGAGTTGASLQKSLAGQVKFTLTNANIQIVSPKLKQFLQPVAVMLSTPELLNSPLNGVNARTEMGNGRIDFKVIELVSPMFRLDSGGVMPIAEVLTNSPFQNWPVNLYLSRPLAEKARLAPAGTTETYVKLPNFLKVAGTLGNPKAQIEKTALAGTLLEKYGSKIPGVSDTTGGLLQGLGGVLSGSQTARTNQTPNTNTNQPPATDKPSLFDLLKKPNK